MERLFQWLKAAKNRSFTLCRAGDKFFCCMRFVTKWDLPKEWPLDYGRFNPAEAIGYSNSSYEEAIDNAFRELPTNT